MSLKILTLDFEMVLNKIIRYQHNSNLAVMILGYFLKNTMSLHIGNVMNMNLWFHIHLYMHASSKEERQKRTHLGDNIVFNWKQT